jgi:uncharacterized membrane protein
MRIVEIIKTGLYIISLIVICLISVVRVVADEPVVRVVIFWMNGCGHCHYVLQNVLPPLQEQYGGRLEIRFIELVTVEEVDLIYAVAEAYGIEQNDVGVPFLVVGDQILVGSAEVEQQLPGLIEDYLSAGGVDYPDVPLLLDMLPNYSTENPESSPFLIETIEEEPSQATAVPTETTTKTLSAEAVLTDQPERSVTATGVDESPNQAATMAVLGTKVPETLSPEEIFLSEGASSNGFALAMVVQVAMVAALVFVGVMLWRASVGKPLPSEPHWVGLALPILALIGISVAGYLAFVETQPVEAVCGPIGDCNTVQSSPYAKLFGLIPIGILGVLGYGLILAASLWAWFSKGASKYIYLIIFGVALIGTLFSIYLTYLELFVIRAVCMWCLSSAVIMALIMLLSLFPALTEAEEL